MDTKRRALGLFIAAIIVLSCTLTSASALILDKSIEVGESGLTVTILGTDDSDMESFSVVQNSGGEFEYDINTTVFDQVTNTWVKETNAQMGDNVTFRINCSFKNFSKMCGDGWASTIVGNESYPENCKFVDVSAEVKVVDDDVYLNITNFFVADGCGKGIYEVIFTAYCVNASSGEIVVVDTMRDSATVNVDCPAPALTPTGLIALISLLSAIAAVILVRKRR